jgi:hypothetical protein
MKPCTEDDYQVYYRECNVLTNKRLKTFAWRVPSICDSRAFKGSVELPKDEEVPCRGCGRGQFWEIETKAKAFCDVGFYQELDNHEGALDRIRACQPCERGHYAPKILDFGHFEEMPKDYLTAICSEVNDIGDPKNCDLMTGWHVNPHGQLDSGTGLRQGMKLQLKTHVEITNELQGGKVTISYQLKNFGKDEQFRIGVNG